MKLSLSDDKIEAYLHPELGEPGTKIPVDSLRQFLAESGITDSALFPVMEQIAASGLPADDQLIASGAAPKRGKDGWVEHRFKNVKKSEECARDPHACLLEICNVRVDEVLSVLHPPEAGEDGRTVFGGTLPAQPGKAARLSAGENTKLSEDGSAIVATIDGCARATSSGTVSVEPILRINGDVGPATGNIDFIGTLVVMGDVKSEYCVKAGKNLEIHGGVGDAELTAGQDATIMQGFFGTGKGMLRAGGNVRLKLVHFQSVFAGMDIHVERESIAARLHAQRRISGPRAVIVGGVLEAGEEIEVWDLGNGEETNVIAQVGSRPRLLERLTELDRQHQNLEKQLTDIKAGVYKLVRFQLDAGKLSAEQDVLLAKLKRVQEELPRELAVIEANQKSVRESIQNSIAARVCTYGTVAANALIEINGIKRMVQQPMREVTFVEKSGRIEQVAA